MNLLLYGHLYVVALLICAFLFMEKKIKEINASSLLPFRSSFMDHSLRDNTIIRVNISVLKLRFEPKTNSLFGKDSNGSYLSRPYVHCCL